MTFYVVHSFQTTLEWILDTQGVCLVQEAMKLTGMLAAGVVVLALSSLQVGDLGAGFSSPDCTSAKLKLKPSAWLQGAFAARNLQQAPGLNAALNQQVILIATCCLLESFEVWILY